MKLYIKVWLKGMGLWPCDVVPDVLCEWCGNAFVKAVHHIVFRGMGGSKALDFFENLIGLCAECHDMAEAGKITKEQFKQVTENRHECNRN